MKSSVINRMLGPNPDKPEPNRLKNHFASDELLGFSDKCLKCKSAYLSDWVLLNPIFAAGFGSS